LWIYSLISAFYAAERTGNLPQVIKALWEALAQSKHELGAGDPPA